MPDIIPPNVTQPITNASQFMQLVFRTWTQLLTRRVNQIVPEGGSTGQILSKASDDDYDTEWVFGGGGGSVFSVFGRVGSVVAVSGDYTAAQITNAYDLTSNDSDDVTEGATNLYYTSGRFDTDFSGKTTTDLSEGTNLYWTQGRFDTAYDAKSELFQAQKTTSQASSTSWTDITSWDASDIEDANYSWDTATGVLTINTTGWFSVSFHVLSDQSGNNRVEGAVKLVDSSGDVAGAEDRQYLSRNNTQDVGSAQLNSFLYNVVSTGETLKLQWQHVGVANDIINARLTVMKVG